MLLLLLEFQSLKRNEQDVCLHGEFTNRSTPNDVYSDLLLSDDEIGNGTLPGNATFSVMHPSQVFHEQDLCETPQSLRPIPRQVSTYQEMKQFENIRDREEDFESKDTDSTVNLKQVKGNRRRPKAARLRRNQHGPVAQESIDSETPSSPFTPNASEGENAQYNKIEINAEHTIGIVNKLNKLGIEKRSKKKKNHSELVKSSDSQQVKGKRGSGKYPKTSTPNNSPLSPTKTDNRCVSFSKTEEKGSQIRKISAETKQKETLKVGNRTGIKQEQASTEKNSNKTKNKNYASKNKKESYAQKSFGYESQNVISATVNDSGKIRSAVERHQFQGTNLNVAVSAKKMKEKVKYRNDDYAHEKIKKSKQERYEEHFSGKDIEELSSCSKEDKDAYYVKKQPHGVDDKRKRSSFVSISEQVWLLLVDADFFLLLSQCLS